MSATIWMIGKYVAPARNAKVGARGFLLLREFVRQGHQAVLLTSDSNHVANTPTFAGPLLDEDIDGVHVRWLRTLKYGAPSSLKRMLSWLDFEWRIVRMPDADLPRPDVVIASSLSLFSIFSGLWLRRKYGCKLVFEIRDIWPLLLVAAGRISTLHPLYLALRAVELLGYRKADLVVGTMPNLREHVEESIGEGRQVVCIPQGVEAAHVGQAAPLPPGFADAYLSRDAFTVCYAGSIGADNALEPLLDCATAMQGDASVHFLIVGDGYLKQDLVSRYGALPNVTFAPRVEKQEVAAVLAAADIVYFSVHQSDALRFGQSLNKVIDYMASAKPVLASYTGFPSMIDEADCGVFVPAGDVEALRDAIVRFAHMPADAREEMGQRGRQWLLANRTYDVLGRQYLACLGLDATGGHAAPAQPVDSQIPATHRP